MTYEENYLAHFGIKGQRWGLRRYQNEDGTLTADGRERYKELAVSAGNEAGQHKRMANASYQSMKNPDYVKKYGRDYFKKTAEEHQKEAKKYADMKKKYESILKSNVANMTMADLKKLNKEHSTSKNSTKVFAENFGDWFFGRARPKGNVKKW